MAKQTPKPRIVVVRPTRPGWAEEGLPPRPGMPARDPERHGPEGREPQRPTPSGRADS